VRACVRAMHVLVYSIQVTGLVLAMVGHPRSYMTVIIIAVAFTCTF